MIKIRTVFHRGHPALVAPGFGTIAALARAVLDAEPVLDDLAIETDFRAHPDVVMVVAPGVHISARARQTVQDRAVPVGVLVQYRHRRLPHFATGTRSGRWGPKVTAYAWGATMPEAVARCGKLLVP